MRTVIVDGYVDEPACFGVPPYISPYIRYIAGALVESGQKTDDIFYFTIDQLRLPGSSDFSVIREADLVIILAGMTVPGKYLRSTPITPSEIDYLCKNSKGIKILGGPVRLGYSKEGGQKATGLTLQDNTYLASGDIEAFVSDLFDESGKLVSPDSIDSRFRTTDEIAKWSQKGAFIIEQHPDFPNVMCEMETYRGCGRDVHCTFCTESSYGSSDYRNVRDVISEVEQLYSFGARFFRIGRQPDLFSYQSMDIGDSVRKPDVEALKLLYSGIRSVAPDLKVLHMDNANPLTIATYPDECREIMKTIVKYHTSGDIAAMGMESADPAVIKANNLKAYPDQVFEAIKIMNEIGAKRGSSGLPELLPGLNFVHGLPGESKNTFKLNYDFLKNVLYSDLLLRRINIRQVMAFPSTPLENMELPSYPKQFSKYREKVRKEIDLPMLRKVVPKGTVLKDILCEVVNEGKGSFWTSGRQMGTYPLLIQIPEKLPLWQFLDVMVTGHGFRSIAGVPYPLDINTASGRLMKEAGILPSEIAAILRLRPFKNKVDAMEKVPGISGKKSFVTVL
ncbi:radical SAM superfamily enzyme with C-terminal helix-hairpin-helix motif [Methanohalophilus levihalophilus]|uniref:radical SAM protein n=1 Tax=Methanohalophilus levihalophilus TaxID=1431282 RepID=UPI001AE3D0A1|nr:radical SAM protein [Methanohalophilus levihalophilus]MBP2030293.1 radical SAM superfamily enzyme with C-terminal helix-hairpin-helix motif [Methanohalophilus levihalophilus]